jgi:hypothetical protein
MNHICSWVSVGVLATLAAMPAFSAEYTSTVSELQPNHVSEDCIFFRLSGVTGITPASPGDWFACGAPATITPTWCVADIRQNRRVYCWLARNLS